MRPVVVSAACNQDRYAIGPVVAESKQVGGALTRSIRAAGPQRSLLIRRPPCLDIAIDFVGRDLDEPIDPPLADGIQKDRSPENGGAQKRRGVRDTAAD